MGVLKGGRQPYHRILTMATFQDVGVICFNGEIPDECRGCLWWEEECLKGPHQCRNRLNPICSLYLDQLMAPGPLPADSE